LRVLIDKALAVGATSCCRSRHLTTVGTGWSLAGPPLKGKRKWPSPGGGRGNHSLSYERVQRLAAKFDWKRSQEGEHYRLRRLRRAAAELDLATSSLSGRDDEEPKTAGDHDTGESSYQEVLCYFVRPPAALVVR
jgi:hypothetical protein